MRAREMAGVAYVTERDAPSRVLAAPSLRDGLNIPMHGAINK